MITDSLNHASIIDGIRLCKARRLRYANNDMADLEKQLLQAKADGARYKMIATDGVFSMDGIIANLKAICDLADKHDALVMVDDSHAVGFVGAKGRGTPEHCGVIGRVDIITGTLGKALGGASGGYTAASRQVVAWLRNRSRPYLFSNTLMPVIAHASIKVLDLLQGKRRAAREASSQRRAFPPRDDEARLHARPAQVTRSSRDAGDAALAQSMANKPLPRASIDRLLLPVVPKGQARIRVQMSAAHEHSTSIARSLRSRRLAELGVICS